MVAGGALVQTGLAAVQSSLARAQQGLEGAAGSRNRAGILHETTVFQYLA